MRTGTASRRMFGPSLRLFSRPFVASFRCACHVLSFMGPYRTGVSSGRFRVAVGVHPRWPRPSRRVLRRVGRAQRSTHLDLAGQPWHGRFTGTARPHAHFESTGSSRTSRRCAAISRSTRWTCSGTRPAAGSVSCTRPDIRNGFITLCWLIRRSGSSECSPISASTRSWPDGRTSRGTPTLSTPCTRRPLRPRSSNGFAGRSAPLLYGRWNAAARKQAAAEPAQFASAASEGFYAGFEAGPRRFRSAWRR